MQTLISNKSKILQIIEKIENFDNSLFIHYNIPNIPINDNTISIVMTSSNRSKQVYFTLKTIYKCSFKNIQVIIIDDSDIDPVNKKILNIFPFNIDFIVIKRENKNWNNPVVNYNIGFKFIKGSKVVIQNGEICYIGDILTWISTNTFDNNYYVFDVKGVSSQENNQIIYNTENLTTEIYKKDIYLHWFQGKMRCLNYHFLTCMTTKTFNKIKNFSYDYTFGFAYDDDDFVLKIKSNKINIINLFHDEYNFGGIHLWHSNSGNNLKNIESNQYIYKLKKKEYDLSGKYSDFLYIKDININLNKNINLLSLQNLLIKFKTIKIINFNISKKNMTKQINTFQKSLLRGYCYKNSKIKIPKNLYFKFNYIK
jgi:hypothetical protein